MLSSKYLFTQILFRNQQLQFESSVNAVLGNKPNVTVHVDRVTPAPGTKSLVLIYVQEKNPNGKIISKI